MTMLMGYGATFSGWPEAFRAQRIADNHAPRAILRTTWGLFIDQETTAEPDRDLPSGRFSIEVQSQQASGHKNLGIACDTCIAVLDPNLHEFLARHRAVDSDMADAAVDGHLALSVVVSPKEDKHAEAITLVGLTSYLIQIVDEGRLDRVIQAGCSA